MRTYGRINQVNGIGGQWVEIDTDANGFNDNCFLTTLCQSIKLNLGESPFFSSVGIPQVPSIVQQIFPDFYVANLQSLYATSFASLIITRVQGSFPPVYNVRAAFRPGAVLPEAVAT
jgi:hypothetical protein